MRSRQHSRGMTLVELVVAMVVIGICVVSALGLLSSLAMRSSTSMLRTQSTAIATSYLDEILGKRYAADGVEATRSLYDDVLDYDGLDDMGARNTNGVLIAGLGGYRIQVQVIDDPVANVANARRVTVTIIDPNDTSVVLTGYRTEYSGQVMY